jgi:hypothetical protein
MASKNIAVFGIYDHRQAVEECVTLLKDGGFRNTDVSVLFSENAGSKDLATEKATKLPEGATAGASTGAVVGGVLGWLVGMLAGWNRGDGDSRDWAFGSGRADRGCPSRNGRRGGGWWRYRWIDRSRNSRVRGQALRRASVARRDSAFRALR